MIDWVTTELPCTHRKLEAGMVCKVKPDGELDWMAPCRVSVAGSHDSSIQVRSGELESADVAKTLLVSGNPSKFLQGHNVFGSDNLLSLVFDMFLKVCRSLSISPKLNELRQVKQGAYVVKTIDINYSYELPSRGDVLAWIRAAEYKSKTRHGRAQMKGGTIYWGKSSQRWALKAYSKGEEIEAPKHRIPDALGATKIPKWADNKLRIELRLKNKMMQEIGIKTAADLTPERVRELYFEYLGKLEMKEQIALSTEQQLELPQRLRSTYILWRSGEDLRYTLPKTTFYRHRSELKEYGIDITIRCAGTDRSNVVPLVRILEAKPAPVPAWAFEQNLIHHSARMSAC